jgi:hypothetical protein
MKVRVVTTATDLNHPGFKHFVKSLNKFNWQYDVLIHNYVAYGSKMLNAYHYALSTDATHLFILDAYDIVVLSTMQEALNKLPRISGITFNAEHMCWPYTEWSTEYPKIDSYWKYLNGGAAFVEKNAFIKMFEAHPIKDIDNDQEVLGRIYLDHRNEFDMHLDTNCDVFQSIAFEKPNEFSYNDQRLINNITKTIPVIIHGNGRTDMTKIYNLL